MTPLALPSAEKFVTYKHTQKNYKKTNKHEKIYPHLAYRHVLITNKEEDKLHTVLLAEKFTHFKQQSRPHPKIALHFMMS